MNLIALIQARDHSTRLPNKAMLDVNGMPIIEHVYRRSKAIKRVDGVVVSTSVESPEIINWCRMNDVPYYVGSEKDLLSRHLSALLTHDGHAMVRVTADEIFTDPFEIDKHIAEFKRRDVDLYTNWGMGRAVSEGLDCAIVTSDAMRRANEISSCPREDWITWMMKDGRFVVSHAPVIPYLAHDIQLSVDTTADLVQAREIMEELGNDDFAYAHTVKAWEKVARTCKKCGWKGSRHDSKCAS